MSDVLRVPGTRSLRIGWLTINVGVTARGPNGVNPTWLGFSYGSWLPRVRIFRISSRTYFDVFWYWLCFHGSFIWDAGPLCPDENREC